MSGSPTSNTGVRTTSSAGCAASPEQMGTEVPETIKVCTVVIKDDAGRVLTVRKRGTNALMLPGGKPEQGESVKDTAAREVAEELGIALDLNVLRELGTLSGPAANRSEEHTSELQSRFDLVCRLLLEKKKALTASRVSTRRGRAAVWYPYAASK